MSVYPYHSQQNNVTVNKTIQIHSQSYLDEVTTLAIVKSDL